MFDGETFGKEVTGLVRDYLEREVAPLKAENEELKARIKVLEDRPMPEVIKGEPGEPGKDGAPGKDGKDGLDATSFLVDRDGHLIATLSDGAARDLGQIIGKDGNDGAPGKDGRDGFSLDDFDVERGSDGRTFTLKFEQGDTRHEYELTFPVPVYCGVYKEGDEYVPGDMVTWGGSLWHCDAGTKDKPGTDGWTLAVKKGRDGKDAKVG
jgi:hypothetical protein